MLDCIAIMVRAAIFILRLEGTNEAMGVSRWIRDGAG